MEQVDHQEEQPEYLTVRAAARRIGCSPTTLGRIVDSEEIPAYVLGSRWRRVLWSDVVAYMRSRRPASEAA